MTWAEFQDLGLEPLVLHPSATEYAMASFLVAIVVVTVLRLRPRLRRRPPDPGLLGARAETAYQRVWSAAPAALGLLALLTAATGHAIDLSYVVEEVSRTNVNVRIVDFALVGLRLTSAILVGVAIAVVGFLASAVLTIHRRWRED